MQGKADSPKGNDRKKCKSKCAKKSKSKSAKKGKGKSASPILDIV